MNRITRDEMLMQIAHVVAQRSTCERLAVGAVIAREGRVLSIGYNGVPSKIPHCSSEICDPRQPCNRTLHAETNAIAYAARCGIPTIAAQIYCTDSPCLACAKMILASGIEELIYHRPYRDAFPLRYLSDAGCVVRKA